MAKVIAVTEAIKSLAEAESRLNLSRTEDEAFFAEWQAELPNLSDAEQTGLDRLRRRLLYHRADGELLEGAVTLLVASPLLEMAGFYDPPFRMKAESAIEIAIDDGEETLRGRIDILILLQQLWVMVLECKKTTISTRSALPQALAYMMANPDLDKPRFGMLTNGDDVLFVKLMAQPTPEYGLSRAFSIYTVPSELRSAFQVLKHLGQGIS
ncbi:MAG: type I restriction enzyme HsdR N-terminal domain-containing protein [Microcoleus sp. PH2017_10_PVI_O_A]|uniref:type I restriction endonuclease n=1 Tax=unclassified Microcoleus TaxID=2642155 RepID=UPI001D5CA110|nr:MULTISPECIES: type I restriction endonuclease [unclassified Microcoleus]TAE81304.1 MAG: type I restriction endonuclease subunit R [Oscillatoriales cyanobacterium]MCC3405420.1 type I restriction enzyme HsdR N-terminal domain-containing protein [Microcoleus sp. PH2017_10_PVI_O_A]MCC3459413.1 type I restriction enzyme HsdR N-terminal domain-containing protein [Microcoleus sp. PH2017_11_PCY_U_A]MCC3477693.1 type I restriction enzyme HsdR N-terminal domain-containing protein [Microcoleus sp. PH20